MMMTMRPSFPASMPGPSLLSLASGPASPRIAEPEDEYQALMLAEFGPLVPLPSDDELQAMMMLAAAADDDEDIQSQAPLLLLPEDESSQAMLGNDKNGMQACLPIPPCPCPCPCPGDKKSRKKKRKNRPPSSAEDDDFEESSKRAKDEEVEELPSPRATNKMMASCLLERRHAAPGPSETEGQTIICCLCKELAGDSPCCPLHQNVRYWSWMLEMGDGEIPAAGSGDGVVVPTRRTESKKKVLTYIRWRSRAWMPSRFYLEQSSGHAQVEMARQE